MTAAPAAAGRRPGPGAAAIVALTVPLAWDPTVAYQLPRLLRLAWEAERLGVSMLELALPARPRLTDQTAQQTLVGMLRHSTGLLVTADGRATPPSRLPTQAHLVTLDLATVARTEQRVPSRARRLAAWLADSGCVAEWLVGLESRHLATADRLGAYGPPPYLVRVLLPFAGPAHTVLQVAGRSLRELADTVPEATVLTIASPVAATHLPTLARLCGPTLARPVVDCWRISAPPAAWEPAPSLETRQRVGALCAWLADCGYTPTTPAVTARHLTLTIPIPDAASSGLAAGTG